MTEMTAVLLRSLQVLTSMTIYDEDINIWDDLMKSNLHAPVNRAKQRAGMPCVSRLEPEGFANVFTGTRPLCSYLPMAGQTTSTRWIRRT